MGIVDNVHKKFDEIKNRHLAAKERDLELDERKASIEDREAQMKMRMIERTNAIKLKQAENQQKIAVLRSQTPVVAGRGGFFKNIGRIANNTLTAFSQGQGQQPQYQRQAKAQPRYQQQRYVQQQPRQFTGLNLSNPLGNVAKINVGAYLNRIPTRQDPSEMQYGQYGRAAPRRVHHQKHHKRR